MVSRQAIAAAVAVDVTCVVVFALAGSRSHETGDGLGGVAWIAAPFVVGAVIGWLVSPTGATRPAAVRTGVHVWVAAVVIGMVARRFVWGGGTAPSFVVVAAIALGALLVGWRALRASLRRRAAVRSVRPPSKAER